MGRRNHPAATHRRRWQAVRLAMLERSGYRCQSCLRPGRLELDHIRPIAAGGEAWAESNLQVLCRGCHIAKTATENRGEPMPAAVREWADWEAL